MQLDNKQLTEIQKVLHKGDFDRLTGMTYAEAVRDMLDVAAGIIPIEDFLEA